MTEADHHFPIMGGRGRVVLAAPDRSAAELETVARDIQALCEVVQAQLTRFDPQSELSRFNRWEPGPPPSLLLRRLALAARWAGESTDGLVDATRLGELRRSDAPRAPLAEALAAAPARRPAAAHRDRGYATLGMSEDGGIRRGPGVQLDSGGLAKGLAADLAADLIPAEVRYAISVGGDVALGGGEQSITVEPAVPGADPVALRVPGGGVATSGISARLWRRDDGTYAHHLLDPSTGEPAWTGLVAVTAVAAGALQAEVLAKHALLSGARDARRLLRRSGGVLHHEDGSLETVAAAPVVRLRLAA
jgi:thiamine biosynthesis lipoprotein